MKELIFNTTENWAKTDNLAQYILKEIPKYHPNDPRYLTFWREQKRRCIEGIWGREFGQYAYFPGFLYFYGNFCTLVDTDKRTKETFKIRPFCHDLEREQACAMLEARGFSGWEKDDVFTSNDLWFEYHENGLPEPEYCNYNLINKDGNLKKYISPRENIRKLHNEPMGIPLIENESKDNMTIGSRGGGKQLQLNEPVRVENGWSTIGDINIGDSVYSSEGKLCKVTNKSDVEEYPYYQITLRDGRTIEACENHLWKVWSKNKNRNKKTDNPIYCEMSTKEMFSKYYNERIDSKHKAKYNEIKKTKEFTLALPTMKPIVGPDVDLPLDPYLLGLLLGDGCITKHVMLESEDSEIMEYCVNYSFSRGWTTRLKVHDNKKSNTLYFTNKNKVEKSLKDVLTDLNLSGANSHTKFIPEEYLYASKAQRLELLRGLMDTDGFADQRHIEYYTASKQLSNDVCNLTRSLGINCRTVEKDTHYKKDGIKVECSICYRTSFYTGERLFNLPRKIFDYSNKSKAGKSKWYKTFIVDIKPIGNRVGQCIAVDSEDRTYITKDYIVTHNSYFIALAGLLYFICFDGLVKYNPNDLKKRKIEVCLGSGDTDKSGDLMSKIVDCMNEFAINEDLGVWGKQGDSDWTPIPFYRDMSGPKGSGNKEKGGWRHNYKKKVNGRWVEGFGTQTSLFHVCYSDKKKGGAEAAAGGRYNLSVWEEVGLSENVQDGWNSNRATVRRNGIKFGIQWFLGTSGNIDLIIPSKEMFTDPKSFDLLEFPDHWEQSGSIGFFIPAYMTYRQFKDENGNTDLKKAKEHWLKGYRKAHESDNPKTIRMYQMNYPAIPSHMWVTDKNYLFPYEETAKREQELRVNNNYKKIGTPIDLAWDSNMQEGVSYEIMHDAEPFYEFPISNKRESLEGCIMMYEPPVKINGVIPNDMYIFTHDPYVSDNLEDGESVGCSHVFMNPKYIPQGYNGNFMVATYHGKAKGGKREYYERFEKLIAFYGNPIRGVWYEANRGEFLRSYFEKKNKLHLLCLRPQFTKGDSTQIRNITQYGVIVGNKVAKVSMIDNTHDWLIEDTVYNGFNKKVIETIPCMFTLRQMMHYKLEEGDNFDAISSLIIAPLAIHELTHHEIKKAKRQNRNPLSFLSTNERQFGPIDYQIKTNKFHEKYSRENNNESGVVQL